MLIKNYAGHPAGNTLTIIEDVTDVIVHMGMFSLNSSGPQLEGLRKPTTWVDTLAVVDANAPCSRDNALETQANLQKFIDYTDKEGVRCRLCVYSFAYVCNDEGKTIEKVVVEH